MFSVLPALSLTQLAVLKNTRGRAGAFPNLQKRNGATPIRREVETEPLKNDHQEETAMMQAGIFTGYFPYALKETAERIRKLDFNTVQLDLTFKDMDLSTSAITRDKCRTIR